MFTETSVYFHLSARRYIPGHRTLQRNYNFIRARKICAVDSGCLYEEQIHGEVVSFVLYGSLPNIITITVYLR
jgi:hypothetical protein